MKKINILFIHGFPMSSCIWNNQISHLQNTYKCHAIDLPGYGQNTNIDDKFQHSIDNYSDYVHGYIKDNYLKPVHLVGMSMGGSVALNISRRYPDAIKSLTIAHTSAIVDTDEEKSARDKVIKSIENGKLDEFIEWFANRLLSPKTNNEIKQRYIGLMQEASQQVIIDGYKAIRNREDEFSNLKNLSIPVLVITGKDDVGSSPKEMLEMAQAISNAIYKEIDDCGHLAPLEQPDALNSILTNWFSHFIKN